MPRIYIPADSACRSLGADDVALAIADYAADNQMDIELIRNGSRGLYWLEPMVEVETDQGRIAFGPVFASQVESLFAGKAVPTRDHPQCLGLTEEIPELSCQDRLTFSRVGLIEPLSVSDYIAHGGYQGLKNALALSAGEIVAAVTESGLRGRGGAAFPTGIKWRTTLETEADQKYIVCNADEGDSGTFADRMMMESDPFCLLEGMTIAGLGTGATYGYLYIRAEYPQAIETMNAAIEIARDNGYLGNDVCGSGKSFDIEVRKAAGAYICGEETSLLESLEGKRGIVRYRPPLPAIKGLFGKPTIVNNVISLATVPIILDKGADYYKNYGSGKSRGTLTLQLAGNVKRGGLFELPFGYSLAEALNTLGGGTASGRPVRAIQAGGPLGAYIAPANFETPLDYESFAGIGAMLGHGGIVVFDDSADLGEMARFAMEFCAIESCGKCTPCRVGAIRGVEVIDRIRNGENADSNRTLLKDLCHTMVDGSLCALGGMAPFPVLSILEQFPEEL